MFKKPLAHHSNATAIKSSARRQLLSAIYDQYPILRSLAISNDNNANANNETSEDGLSEKELGRLILPEGVRSASIETSGGIEGMFWLNTDGDPLWMAFGRNSKVYIPTLYLLFLPLLKPFLPLIQLHNPVPPPLFTGAPLFIPAVKDLRRPWLLPDVPEGAVVAFTTAVGPSDTDQVSYVGVGIVAAKGGMRGAVELREQTLRGGLDRDEGKFCDIMCIVGDHLWEMGSKSTLQSFIAPPPANPLVQPPATAQNPTAGPSRSRSSLPSHSVPNAEISSDDISTLSINDHPTSGPTSSERLCPSEISTLLTLALLQSLTLLEPSSFPMPASLLYSAHILPNRPAFIPKEKREDVVIGKSEWKKLVKWMKEAGKDGLVKIKESKGEVVVQGFDPNHPSIQNHAEHLTIHQEEAKAAKRAAREATSESAVPGLTPTPASTTANGKVKEIAIEELWKPSGPAAPFWDACGVDKSSLHPPSLLKSALDGYISKHHLVDTDPRYLLLDDELGKACGMKKPTPGERLARDEVVKRLKAGVAWSVSIDGVVRRGTPSPIIMTVKTRQGRKTITTLASLETFFPPSEIDDLAEQLRKLCAGATSIQPLNGASPRSGLREVSIQGNQVKIVERVLVERGVPKRWIREGDKK